MQVKQLPLVELKPYWRNPRHNDAAVPGTKDSIEQFGFNQPILLDTENVIICGHTRYRAALELGLAEVPVIVLDHLSADQAKAYRIADNKPGEASEWDEAKLVQELRELADPTKMAGFFGDGELDRMLAPPSMTTHKVKPQDIERATQDQQGLQGDRSEATQQRYIETACPHCAQVYYLDREEVIRERPSTMPPDGSTVVKLSE